MDPHACRLPDPPTATPTPEPLHEGHEAHTPATPGKSAATRVLMRTAPASQQTTQGQMLLRKEVIQPHLPVRLPCYDFVPIAGPTFDRSLPRTGWATGFGCCRLS
jgi:hypothetical protein